MEYYYSAINRNEVLIHATTWTNLENIMLSEKQLNTKGFVSDTIIHKNV